MADPTPTPTPKKTDPVHQTLKQVDYHRYTVLGVLCALVALAVIFVGCAPRTASLSNPGERVDAASFEHEAVVQVAAQEKALIALGNEEAALIAEYEQRRAVLAGGAKGIEADASALAARVEMGRADLAKQSEARDQILATLGGLATAAVEGAANPAAIVMAVLSVLSLAGNAGLALDVHRKNRIIATGTDAGGGSAAETASV